MPGLSTGESTSSPRSRWSSTRRSARRSWTPRRGPAGRSWLTRSWKGREKIDIPKAEGGHGGGDKRLLDLVFRGGEPACGRMPLAKDEGSLMATASLAGVTVPDHLALPGSRAGALSCLTGIAARQSCDEDRRVRVDELVKL